MLLVLSVSAVAGVQDQDGDAQTGEPQTVTVHMKNIQFVPARITVTPGTRIIWVNDDPVDHDVTSGISIIGRKARGLPKTKFPDGRFSSGLFGKGKTYETHFDKPGEYPYFCNVHPFMVGNIVVQTADGGKAAVSSPP